MREFTRMIYAEFERQATEYVALRQQFAQTTVDLRQARETLAGALKQADATWRPTRSANRRPPARPAPAEPAAQP